MKRFALSLVIAVSLAASAALAGTPVNLRDTLVDNDGRITLGDLFEDAGRAAGVPVANGPQPGANVVLDAGQVQRIALANGLEWANPNGYRRLVVSGGARDAQPNPAASQASAPVAGSKLVETLTYSRSLAAGEIIQPEDVAWTKVQSHLVPADAPRDAEAVIGKAAKRPIREGAAVAAHDLANPRVIRKGDLVQVAYLADGVNLVMQGTAQSDGYAGETVQILNTQSKKTIEAIAVAPGKAATGPGAEALRAPASSTFASR